MISKLRDRAEEENEEEEEEEEERDTKLGMPASPHGHWP